MRVYSIFGNISQYRQIRKLLILNYLYIFCCFGTSIVINKADRLLRLMNSNIKLLLIDDHEINSLYIGFMFNKLGISFDIATNKKQALELISKNDYTVVLMDIQMPNNDGFDVAKSVRKFNLKVPIIAFTSLPEEEVLPKAIDYGMNDYILKPNGMEQLWGIVDRFRASA